LGSREEIAMKTFLSTLTVVIVFFGRPQLAAGTKLKPETIRAWETYVQLTEKRIETELTNTSGFLRADLLKPGEATTITTTIKKAQVYIAKLRTAAADGRDLNVPDGMIHHWFGSIFVPEVNLQTMLDWVKDYDQHHRYFKEVEASKLLSRDGDMFRVFFR